MVRNSNLCCSVRNLLVYTCRYPGGKTMKWEYKIIKLYPVPADRLLQLNTAGALGWELVAVVYNDAFLKRVIGSQ
jgi:hypothetical protein